MQLAAARRFPTLRWLMAVVVVLAAGGFWWSKHRRLTSRIRLLPHPNHEHVSVQRSAVFFEKLKGRWLRAEGSYIVEVRSVRLASGKMNAA